MPGIYGQPGPAPWSFLPLDSAAQNLPENFLLLPAVMAVGVWQQTPTPRCCTVQGCRAVSCGNEAAFIFEIKKMMNQTTHNIDPTVIAAPPLPLLIDYKPKFDMAFVERLLGKKRRNTLSKPTARRLARLHPPVAEKLKPRVTWRTFSISSATDGQVTLDNGTSFNSRKMAASLNGAEKVICFVATVGPAIDQLIDQLMDKGHFADAYVVDALGSGAIEYTADSFQDDIEKDATDQQYVAGMRFSPGYCDWPLAEQHKIFSLLDCDPIGVSLSDSALMAPRKSVSAVFGLYDHESPPKRFNPCNLCRKENCIARRPGASPEIN